MPRPTKAGPTQPTSGNNPGTGCDVGQARFQYNSVIPCPATISLPGARSIAPRRCCDATPDHFSVAAQPIWADDRKDDERFSTRTRTVVAGHRGILGSLSGIDCRPPKPIAKCVNHFSKMLVSQLSWTHNCATSLPREADTIRDLLRNCNAPDFTTELII